MSRERITHADLDRALQQHAGALKALGIAPPETERLRLEHGSKLNGIAYKLYTAQVHGGGVKNPPVGSDFLGWTASEAYNAITDRTAVLRDVAWRTVATHTDAVWIAEDGSYGMCAVKRYSLTDLTETERGELFDLLDRTPDYERQAVAAEWFAAD